MPFMQELTGDGFSQTKFVPLSKFPHPADGIAPSPGIGLFVACQLRKRCIDHIVHGAVSATGKLLSDDLFLIGFEFDDHNQLHDLMLTHSMSALLTPQSIA
jgi:hypothetical protein